MRGLSRSLAIVKREVKTAFVTPLPYVLLSSFMMLCGTFFFGILEGFHFVVQKASTDPDIVPNLNEYVVLPYLRTVEVLLLFLLPLVTMRSVAEERSRGTFELLITSPVSPAELIIGKYLGVTFLVMFAIALSFAFPLALFFVSRPELSPMLVGFFGLIMFALGLTAIGVGISACVGTPIIAGIASLVCFVLLYVCDAPAGYLPNNVVEVLRYISPANHSEHCFRGVLQSSDVIYYASVISIGLFISFRAVEAQRWR